mgnify:CR=1 FL=1
MYCLFLLRLFSSKEYICYASSKIFLHNKYLDNILEHGATKAEEMAEKKMTSGPEICAHRSYRTSKTAALLI